MRRPDWLLWLAALPAAISWAQPLKPGPQVLTFFSGVDDSDQPYGLYLPNNYDTARKYPLVISLHGAGSNHRLNLRRVFGKGNLPGESDFEATRYFPTLKDVDYIVASPLARGTLGYQGIPEKDVYDVLADVERRFSIDEDRVYLTGLSMGGGGALWIGLTRPGIWAAIAAVCAEAPPQTGALAPNALNLPVRLFHGDADPTVPVASSRLWNDRLRELGTPVEYTEYPNVRHNSWDNAYRDGAIFDWFSQHVRNRYPDRVRFVTDRFKYNRAYWVTVDSLVPGTLASMDARFTGLNQLEITTDAVDAFTLDLAKHPKIAARRPVMVTVDGHRVPGAGMTFVRNGVTWKRTKFTANPRAKRTGSEGPIADAIAARHIYVYGTADSPGQDELRNRRAAAEKAAEWSSVRARLLLTFQVMSDQQVKPADVEGANLVLFGTRETNSLIEKLAANLPMELNAGAADYGLVYVYPNGNRYVLINSGLPWWTGAAPDRGGPPAPFRLLSGMRDYLLFKGSIDSRVAQGFFDRNWRLPGNDAGTIASTGAVKLKQ